MWKTHKDIAPKTPPYKRQSLTDMRFLYYNIAKISNINEPPKQYRDKMFQQSEVFLKETLKELDSSWLNLFNN